MGLLAAPGGPAGAAELTRFPLVPGLVPGLWRVPGNLILSGVIVFRPGNLILLSVIVSRPELDFCLV